MRLVTGKQVAVVFGHPTEMATSRSPPQAKEVPPSVAGFEMPLGLTKEHRRSVQVLPLLLFAVQFCLVCLASCPVQVQYFPSINRPEFHFTFFRCPWSVNKCRQVIPSIRASRHLKFTLRCQLPWHALCITSKARQINHLMQMTQMMHMHVR